MNRMLIRNQNGDLRWPLLAYLNSELLNYSYCTSDVDKIYI